MLVEFRKSLRYLISIEIDSKFRPLLNFPVVGGNAIQSLLLLLVVVGVGPALLHCTRRWWIDLLKPG